LDILKAIKERQEK